MTRFIWPALGFALVITLAVLYGKSVQRTADRLQAVLDSARADDSTRQVTAWAHDSIQRDSLEHLKRLGGRQLAAIRYATQRGDSLAGVLRLTLDSTQQGQLDSIMQSHAAALAQAMKTVETFQLAAAQSERLALFWRAQNDTTQAKLTALRTEYAKAKRGTKPLTWISVGAGAALLLVAVLH